MIVILLLGAALTAYLLKIRLPRDEAAAGVSALAAMTWRDFINVVLAALTRRGYTRVFDEDATRDDSEYILEREGRRWLLSCKHGSAFVLGPAILTDMADTIRLHNLAGGLLLTQGRIAEDVKPVAKLQHIELLDRSILWPELRDLMPAEQKLAIEADASRRARKQILLVWLVALLVVVVLLFALPHDEPATDTAQTTAVVDTTPASATPAVTQTPATAAAKLTAPVDLPVLPAPTEQTLDQQRADIASAISTLPMVDRAIWSTQSTLQVYLLQVDANTDAKAVLCPLLEQHPSLAASRIQLTPPPDSQAAVRFIQCRAY
ncbi:MAG: restriction endonuclease [Luteimonas sp.]